MHVWNGSILKERRAKVKAGRAFWGSQIDKYVNGNESCNHAVKIVVILCGCFCMFQLTQIYITQNFREREKFTF